MKIDRLLAAAFAAATLCVASTSFAEERDYPRSANGDYVYDGRMPAMSERMKGKTPHDNIHMTLSGAQKYGRQSVVASVDQDKNNRRQIDITFSE